ncbi:MAG: tetratricopeptide repeat protein [Gammaproteobacteria bacterium]|nr:tetratricopeptide repeat protein [Gammaproteobacteria bacterium]
MYNHSISGKLQICVLVALLTMVGGCSGKEERITKHLERAQTYYAGSDYEKARVEFKNVLQMDPKNIDAIIGQAKVYEALEKWRESAGLFQRVIDIDKTRTDAKENLARIYFLAGGYEKALELIEDVLVSDPDSTVALTVKGALFAQKGDVAGAMKLADMALSATPDHVDAIMLKSSLLTQRKEYDKALQILNQGLKTHTDHPGIISVMARINADIGNESKAIELLQHLVTMNPGDIRYRSRLAGYYTHLKNYDSAEQVFRDGVQQMPEENEPKTAYIEFLVKIGKAEKAIAELRGYLADKYNAGELQLLLARLYEATGKKDLAMKQLSEIISSHELDPDALKARVQLAKMAASEARYDDAQNLVDEVLKENPRDNDGLLVRSKLAMLRNDLPGAIGDLRAIIRDQPNSVEVLNLLGRAHLANKETELAKEQFEKALILSGNSAALQFQIGELYLKHGEDAAALSLLELAAREDTAEVAVLEALFKAQMVNKDYAAARLTSQRVRDKNPEQSLGDYLAGLVRSAEGDHLAALKLFKAAMTKTPAAVEPLKALINSRLALKQVNEAVTDLKLVLKNEPKHFAAQNILGELYVMQKNPEDAVAEFRKALVINPQLATSYRGIASAYMALNEPENAIKILQEGMQTVKLNEVLVDNLAALYQRVGEIDKAIDVYNAALLKEPGSVVYANNLAMLLVSHKADKVSLDRARDLIDNLQGLENPAYLDTMGWVHYSRGEFDQALSSLQKAADVAPGQPILQYHLGMVQYRKGDHVAARQNLQSALDNKADFAGRDEAVATLQQITTGG